MIQNQHRTKPNKWERSRTVVEIRDFDKRVVKVDGSGSQHVQRRESTSNHTAEAPVALPNDQQHDLNVNQKQFRRVREQRLFYDAALGTYEPRNPGY